MSHLVNYKSDEGNLTSVICGNDLAFDIKGFSMARLSCI